jgi:endo-1,4-beta-xylanase
VTKRSFRNVSLRAPGDTRVIYDISVMKTALFWRPLVLLLAVFPAAAADKLPAPAGLHLDFNIPLWPEGKVPLAKGDWSVDKPYLTAVLPPEGKGNGAAVIIMPGGGNIDLFAHQEGMAVAEHLNDWGVAGFILTYRLSPRYTDEARILDGQRAVQLLRARAAEFKLDPKRIGVAGFSAGGTLVRPVAAKPAPGDPAAADPLDRVSSRPDFAIQVYGAGRAAPGESLKDYPPTFILAAAADSTSAPSAQLFIDLKKAGVSAELHIYQKGRHGFGAAEGQPILGDWMGRLESWMKNLGLLEAAK